MLTSLENSYTIHANTIKELATINGCNIRNIHDTCADKNELQSAKLIQTKYLQFAKKN